MTKRSKILRGLASRTDLLSARAAADLMIASARGDENRRKACDLVRLSSEAASPALSMRISAALLSTASDQQAIDREVALARDNVESARRTSAALSRPANRCHSVEQQIEERRSFEERIIDRIGAACGKLRPE